MDNDEIINAVNNIDYDIFHSTEGVEYLNIIFVSNGNFSRVEFCGIVLWDSENDTRLYLYEDNVESIEDCLRRRMKEEISKIKLIKV
jgi:hypothetical protein